MNKVSFTPLNELEKVEEKEYEQWKWEMESDRDAAEKAKEQDDWKELAFDSEEILRHEHNIDLLEDGCFDAEKVLVSKDWKAIKIIGIHTDEGGNKRKAELWAWLKNVDEKELEEVETAGQALQFAWEHYEIDYVEEE